MLERPLADVAGDGTASLRLLSPREAEVLEVASLGFSNGEIAARLGVSVHAVKFHLAGIYRKLGVTNRTAASVIYSRSSSPRLAHDGPELG